MRKCPRCGAGYEDAIAFCPVDGARTEAQEPFEARDSLIGTVIDGRYRIEQRIGEGGMGLVYRATHVVLKRPFALKVIRGDRATDANVVQRFVREARAASGIGHPNIVNINDFGTTEDGSVYLAMEFLDGVTLAQAMQAGPIPYPRALEIFIQIAGALEAAHAQGIVHRDLKPENIMVMRAGTQHEFVKVLDFGIAKVKNAAARITHTGMVFGTPHYMSPEQAAGQPVDHRSDIYSLGVIMYQVLAGALPFAAESLMALMTKHMFEPAPSLREGGHAVPSALDAIVGRCLQKKPELRHASMRELESDLRRVQLSPVSEPRPSAALSSLSLSAGLAGSAPPGAFTAASETLDDAALFDQSSSDEDDEQISVPKRRPVWLWAVAAGILVMVVCSFSLRSPSGEAGPAVDASSAGAFSSKPAAIDAAQLEDEIPQGLSAPAPVPEPPRGSSAQATADGARGPSGPAAAQMSREQAAPAQAAQQKLRVQPTAAPAAARAASTKSNEKIRSATKPESARGESILDPWR